MGSLILPIDSESKAGKTSDAQVEDVSKDPVQEVPESSGEKSSREAAGEDLKNETEEASNNGVIEVTVGGVIEGREEPVEEAPAQDEEEISVTKIEVDLEQIGDAEEEEVAAREDRDASDEGDVDDEDGERIPIRPGMDSREPGLDEGVPVRRDLVEKTPLLGMLGLLIRVQQHSKSLPGGVVVAAPHHSMSGTLLSAGHDVHTGDIAQLLAAALEGRSVVATELRTFVDLNKNPFETRKVEPGHLGELAFRRADKRLKLYYQSQVFAALPQTIIEIHGHARGAFDFEVSTGFQLNERIPQDKSLVVALKTFKKVLRRSLSETKIFGRQPPSVGVYPLDSKVRFTATQTHTFNKIERLRELGLNVAGLHIELSRGLRPSPDDGETDLFYRQLVRCLADAIDAFRQSTGQQVTFDPKDLIVDDCALEREAITLLTEDRFYLQHVLKEMVGRRIAVFSRRDMRLLGLVEGQKIALSALPDFQANIELRANRASFMRTGFVGVAKKFRERLGLSAGDKVYLGKPGQELSRGWIFGYVHEIVDGQSSGVVEVGATLARELTDRNASGENLLISSAGGNDRQVSFVEDDAFPHGKGVAISASLARKLDVTYGDLVYFSSREMLASTEDISDL